MTIITIINFVATVAHAQLLSGANLGDSEDFYLSVGENIVSFIFFFEVLAYFATGMPRHIGFWLDGLLTVASMALAICPEDIPAQVFFQASPHAAPA
jgi:hypothetical protein